ncbi:hypothetical protein [Cupriavidus sp. UYPR2.512]|uniref:hypothetical protein n=1 Tax=Cupriavidus sp. UYPR2.512 TaxID=1080187 RepID=UPI00036838E6|nr:hypothetical protein [Cupriavidus sp. UYPR2.512]UIF90866.1 hypothetical protein KAF44_32275 [Cupriavidus necator]
MAVLSTEAQLIKKLRDEFRIYAPHCLKILDKVGTKRPFVLNRAQQYIHELIEKQLRETGKVRVLILKGRQQGASTYIAGRFYWKTSMAQGRRAFIVAHEQKATDNLFGMVKRYHEHNPLPPSTGATNAKELVFDVLDSGYKLATAGTQDVGRSNTAQLLHGSEFGFWQNAAMHLAGIGNTVADAAGTEIILESTANGIGNQFHAMWQDAEKGDGEWLAIFVPWFWQDEYRAPLQANFELSKDELEYQTAYGLDMEQMQWRRNKIRTYGEGMAWLFDQEYPAVPSLAFQSSTANPLIPPTMVARAVNSDFIESPRAVTVIGCDPAEYGDDRTAICFRRGRMVTRIETHKKKGTMEIAGMLADLYRSREPDALFVDKIGIGSGIVDRLKELNIPVIGVNSAEKPARTDVYANLRAEMWWTMKEWLEDVPCRLPNSSELMSDLSAPGWKHNSNGLKLVESKDDMRKRGIRSPDLADALALTFARPVIPRNAGNDAWGGSSGHAAASTAGY